MPKTRGKSRTGIRRFRSRAQMTNKPRVAHTFLSSLEAPGGLGRRRERTLFPRVPTRGRAEPTRLYPPRPRRLSIAPGGAAADRSDPGPADRWPGRRPLTWCQVLAPHQVPCSLVASLRPCVHPLASHRPHPVRHAASEQSMARKLQSTCSQPGGLARS